MAKSKTLPAKAGRIRTLLRNNGHSATKVNALNLSTPRKLAEAVMKAQGLELDDLRRALEEGQRVY